MQKWHCFPLIVGILAVVMFSSGCSSQAAPQQPAPAEIPTTLIKTTTVPPVSTTQRMIATSLPTIVTAETTPRWICKKDGDGAEICISPEDAAIEAAAATTTGPLDEQITLNGVGNQIVWFEAKRPGTATFLMHNGFGSQTVPNCEEKYFRVELAGTYIRDTVLYDKGMAITGVKRTAYLTNPGRYSLSVKSCGQWRIGVS